MGHGGDCRHVGEVDSWVMVVVEGSAFLIFLLCEARREGVPACLTKEHLSVLSASFLIVTDVAGCLLEYHDLQQSCQPSNSSHINTIQGIVSTCQSSNIAG